MRLNLLISIFLLSACTQWFTPKPIFEESDQLYSIFMVAHYQHQFTGCQPVRNQDQVLQEMAAARRQPPEVFKEEAHYMSFGVTELSARHYFTNRSHCQDFAQNLIDIGFMQK